MAKHKRNLSGRIDKNTVFQEATQWREDFRWSKFFQLLVFAFSLSFIDSVSDFNFASKAESECADLMWKPDVKNLTQKSVWYQTRVNNICSGLLSYYVQSLTYFFVSLAGIFFLLDSLTKLIGTTTRSLILANKVFHTFTPNDS